MLIYFQESYKLNYFVPIYISLDLYFSAKKKKKGILFITFM